MQPYENLLARMSYGIGCRHDGRRRLSYRVASREIPTGVSGIGDPCPGSALRAYT